MGKGRREITREYEIARREVEIGIKSLLSRGHFQEFDEVGKYVRVSFVTSNKIHGGRTSDE